MFGKSKRQAAAEQVSRDSSESTSRSDRALKLVQSSIAAVDENLALKREVREKAAQFLGSLRGPLRLASR